MSNFIESFDFYYNEDGLLVLTSAYHLKRGERCGQGCLHCPYNYEAVQEPERSRLLTERPPEILLKSVKKKYHDKGKER